jgi:hypothetical protein
MPAGRVKVGGGRHIALLVRGLHGRGWTYECRSGYGTSGTHLVIEVRQTCEVPVGRPPAKQGLQSKWGLLTNLMAMGWFVRRLTPGWQGLSGGRKGF